MMLIYQQFLLLYLCSSLIYSFQNIRRPTFGKHYPRLHESLPGRSRQQSPKQNSKSGMQTIFLDRKSVFDIYKKKYIARTDLLMLSSGLLTRRAIISKGLHVARPVLLNILMSRLLDDLLLKSNDSITCCPCCIKASARIKLLVYFQQRHSILTQSSLNPHTILTQSS